MKGKSYNRYNKSTLRYIINDRIRGDEFRLIDDKGEQIDIVTRQEALDEAKRRDVDLVLIAPKAQPPVIKAIDFHKFLYQEEKKNKESKRGQKKSGTKDIKLSLFIGEGDLERFRKKAIEFLESGFQVRIRLPLKGRELGKKPMAFDLINKFIVSLDEPTIAVPPKVQEKIIIAVVVRKK